MTKKKKPRFRDQLAKTLQAERGDVNERFARAEVALGEAQPSSRAPRRKARAKVVRDTFSMPEDDYGIIEEVRQRLIREHATVKNKSEVLRAGLRLLQTLDSEDLLQAAEDVVSLKPGRPAQDN